MTSAQPEDGLPIPQRYWSATAIWLTITLAVLDSAVANVALPTIAREFRVGPSDAIWIVNAYQLAIVTCLLPFAALGEILGYSRLYKIGMTVFTLGSLGCALSDSLTTLVVARVVQGVGGAAIFSINAALVRFTYPHRLLGRGVGYNALVVSVASAVGPTVASAILSVGPWQWLFAVNIPLGVIAFTIAWLSLPRIEPVRRRFDVGAALLSALAFGLVITSLDAITRLERPVVGSVGLLAGIACGIGLVRRERGQERPLLPVDLMRIPIFALSMTTSVCSFAAQTLAFVALPFFFENAMGRSAVETGLLLTPWPIAVGLVGPWAGSLSDRMSAGLLGGIGLAIFAVGLLLLGLMRPDAGALDISWRMVVCGIGFGLFQAPNNRTIIASAPRHRSGAAGGMLATARLTGQTIGATMVAVFFALAPSTGEKVALLAGAALAVFGAAASAARLRTPPPPA